MTFLYKLLCSFRRARRVIIAREAISNRGNEKLVNCDKADRENWV